LFNTRFAVHTNFVQSTATRFSPSLKNIVALGLLRLPLALLELPLFVLLPKLYNELFGLSLASVGAVLLATRVLDAALDPFLGVWIDRAQYKKSLSYRFWIAAFTPLLIVSFGALLWPPEAWIGSQNVALWLGSFSVFTYIAYSVISISYQAWGAQWGNSTTERARVTTVREACGLVGVLLAAIWLSPDKRLALFATMIVFCAIAIVALFKLPAPTNITTTSTANKQSRSTAVTVSPLGEFKRLFRDVKFRWLIGVFAINGIATAIPATLVLFFITDVVGASAKAPMFLASYFLAGAFGMPAWAWLAKRIGLKNTWLVGMLFAVLAFAGALGINRGDEQLFLGICIVTGLALGADLAMPPALLSTLIASNIEQSTDHSNEATYFGLWNLVTKLNLAIAAGVGLPLLQWIGYQPSGGLAASSSIRNVLALSLVYAALPCALKLIAGAALLLAPLKEEPES
jgi:glycoside/pentoside/hexuronide:cation symporter, GPH family